MTMQKKLLSPIHPGEILLEDFMKPMGIGVKQLSDGLRVSSNRISQIVHGRRSITADTALRLGKFFGVPPEIWLDLQSDYNLRVTRQDRWNEINRQVSVFKT